jgi:hypothetical protein
MNRPPGQHGEDVKETEEWEAGKGTPTQYDEDPAPWPPDGTHGDAKPHDDQVPQP